MSETLAEMEASGVGAVGVHTGREHEKRQLVRNGRPYRN